MNVTKNLKNSHEVYRNTPEVLRNDYTSNLNLKNKNEYNSPIFNKIKKNNNIDQLENLSISNQTTRISKNHNNLISSKKPDLIFTNSHKKLISDENNQTESKNIGQKDIKIIKNYDPNISTTLFDDERKTDLIFSKLNSSFNSNLTNSPTRPFKYFESRVKNIPKSRFTAITNPSKKSRMKVKKPLTHCPYKEEEESDNSMENLDSFNINSFSNKMFKNEDSIEENFIKPPERGNQSEAHTFDFDNIKLVFANQEINRSLIEKPQLNWVKEKLNFQDRICNLIEIRSIELNVIPPKIKAIQKSIDLDGVKKYINDLTEFEKKKKENELSSIIDIDKCAGVKCNIF